MRSESRGAPGFQSAKGPRLRGYVLVLGPDGAGKSTLLGELAHRLAANGVEVHRAHHRPQLLGARSWDGRPVAEPHAQKPRSLPGALAKLALVLCDHVLGWCGPWGRHRRKGVLLLERGWYDMTVDPRRYRLPPRLTGLVWLAGRLLPAADLALVLTGDPAQIHARKSEISLEELQRQSNCWRTSAAVAARVVVELDTTTVGQHESVEQAWDAMLLCLTHEPQWRRVPLTPVRLDARAVGEATSAIRAYWPQKSTARAAVALGRLLVTCRLAPPVAAPLPDVSRLWQAMNIAPAGVVALRSSTVSRHLLALSDGRHIRLILKVGAHDDERLRHEYSFLTALAPVRSVFRVPRVYWAGEWEGRFVIACVWEEPVRSRALAVREVVAIATSLVKGPPETGPVVHGDFAPWNIVNTASGGLVVDWEYALKARKPLFDLTHFVVQGGALLQRHSPRQAMQMLCDPGSPGAEHLAAVGEDARDAPAFVLEYLSTWEPRGPAIDYHRALRAQLRTPVNSRSSKSWHVSELDCHPFSGHRSHWDHEEGWRRTWWS